MSCQRILILGGYGNFGKRITETLADTADITLIIAGRRSAPAQQLQAQLQSTARACLETATLDLHAADFETRLAALKPDLVIHTGGPFQGPLKRGNVLAVFEQQRLPDHGADVAGGDAAVENGVGNGMVTAFFGPVAVGTHGRAGGLLRPVGD